VPAKPPSRFWQKARPSSKSTRQYVFGETEALDKMCVRIQYDIDYMRNGSLMFDLMIIGKTLAVVWRDQNAY